MESLGAANVWFSIASPPLRTTLALHVSFFFVSAIYTRLCPLDASLPDDAMIPGLAMFTARAEPLATWMTGLEVAYFKVRNRLFACFGCCVLRDP